MYKLFLIRVMLVPFVFVTTCVVLRLQTL